MGNRDSGIEIIIFRILEIRILENRKSGMLKTGLVHGQIKQPEVLEVSHFDGCPVPRIAKQMTVFQQKIIVFQGQFSIISAFSIENSRKTTRCLCCNSGLPEVALLNEVRVQNLRRENDGKCDKMMEKVMEKVTNDENSDNMMGEVTKSHRLSSIAVPCDFEY